MHKKQHNFMYHLLSKHSEYSWRSLFAYVTLQTISTVLLYSGKIQSQDWVAVSQWLAGFFIVGETAKKFVGKKQTQEDHQQE